MSVFDILCILAGIGQIEKQMQSKFWDILTLEFT